MSHLKIARLCTVSLMRLFFAHSRTPIDSPLDPSFYLNNNCNGLNSQQQPQQQGNQRQQGMMVGQNLRAPILLDNGAMMGYGGNGLGNGANGPNTRLPDSPPITDISASTGSSASPSSGSDSPFSPDAYRNYHNGHGQVEYLG